MSRRAVVLAVTAPIAIPAIMLLIGAMMIMTIAGGGASSAEVPAGGVSGSQLNENAPVPVEYVALIRDAVNNAGCAELTESVLAAQLYQESKFNPQAKSPVGAMGIAQFMPGTWPSWGQDENGNGTASAFEPEDAIPAAARYDCAIVKQVAKVPGDPASLMLAGYNAGPGAVLQYGGIPPYEETQNYVKLILALAVQWSSEPGLVGGGLGPAPPPNAPQVQQTGNSLIDTAVAWAVAQIGSWYQWGGTCQDPFGTSAMGRCDCSSLMQQAYAHAGVALPRTAGEQAYVGQAVTMAEIQPGDLVATLGSDGTKADPGHIAMYVGNGYVVEAPYTGAKVQFLPVSKYTDVVTIRRIVTG